jgi:dTDP-4-dehydrorhamnose reductase
LPDLPGSLGNFRQSSYSLRVPEGAASQRPIAIFGAAGLVGGALLERLGGRAMGFDHARCDITSEEAVRAAMAHAGARVAINCAAWNAVDAAEREPERARRVNADGAAHVARAAEVVVHFSTDFVYDGQKASPYVEEDPPRPLSAYARSKAAGDEAVRVANPRHLILRVGCLYGAGGSNFGSRLLGRLRAGERVRADGERRVQPTWAGALATQVETLLPTGDEPNTTTATTAAPSGWGTFHAMCHGDTTWADFAREMARLAGCAPSLVEAVAADALGLPAPRPRQAVLENRALAARGLDRMPDWRAALAGYLTTQETRA